MTSTHDETILKTDERGRVRVPVERREALLDEFERGGLSGAKFARLAGIKYATFANWVQKRRRDRSEGAAGGMEPMGNTDGSVSVRPTPVRLFEALAEIGSGARAGGLQIELSGGARMQVESPTQLRLAAELLRMLAEPGVRSC